MSAARRDVDWSVAAARLVFDGDDAILRNTVPKPSRRGHRSLPAAAARVLCGRTPTVHINDARSTPVRSPAGLPQGAVLSTTLYIDDIPHPPDTQLALYAYDIAILSQSWRPETITRRLNSTISQLLRYFNKWKLRVNVSKTELILFTKRRPLNPQPLQLQNVTIPWSNTVKCLGLLLDSKLLFTKHLQTVRHKATGTFLKIFPLLSRDSPLTIPNKILLYKLLLRSMITHAAPVWSSTSLTNYRHLQDKNFSCLS
jgi:hypothetical protein